MVVSKKHCSKYVLRNGDFKTKQLQKNNYLEIVIKTMGNMTQEIRSIIGIVKDTLQSITKREIRYKQRNKC